MKGGVERDMALAKISMGSSVIGAFSLLAAEGTITGSGPSRKADREALERTGWRPYSIKVGDSYYSYAGLEPVSALMAIASDYAQYAKNEPDSSKVEHVFMGAVFGTMEYLKEQPYLQGIGDIARLIQSSGGDEPVDMKRLMNQLSQQYGAAVIGGSPAGAYNSLIAGIERLVDPTNKDPRTNPDLPMGVRGFYEAFQRYRSRLPYGNDKLPEALNLWGDPTKAGEGKPYELILPTRVSREQFSEVDDMLWRIGSPVSMPGRKLKDVELDAYQYNHLLTIYGKELDAKEQLRKLMNTEGFSVLSVFQKQKLIQREHSNLMEKAQDLLVSRDPDLQAKIFEIGILKEYNGRYYKP